MGSVPSVGAYNGHSNSPGDVTEAQKTSPSDDQDALARYCRYVRAFEQNKQDELRERQDAYRYYHNKQWSPDELAVLEERGQPDTTDNAIKRKIDFCTGVEQRMRRDPKASPRTPKHEKDTDVATAALRFECDRGGWEEISSDSMMNGLTGGLGSAFVGIKQTPKRLEVDLQAIDPTRVIYDSRSKKPDFSDARWLGVQVWMDIDEVKEQHPDQAEKLDGLLDAGGAGLSSIPAEQDQATQWGDLENRRIRIVELYEKRISPPYNIGVWHYCKFTGSTIIESMVSPYVDEDGTPDCPYVFWSPYIDERGDRYGITRVMLPMQDAINQRSSKVLHELNNRQFWTNSQGTVKDIDEFKREINKPDGHLDFTAGEFGKDFGFVDRSAQLKGQFELLMHSISRMENYGPNPGLVGQGGGVADQSGRAILAQRDSGMTELSPVFERQRHWKLRVFRRIWFRIRQAWTEERWITVTDDPSSVRFIGINQYQTDPMTGQPVATNVVAQIDVDIILDEGPDVVIMQEELLQTLSQMGPLAAGPMGKVVIQLSNVPNKEYMMGLIDQAMQPPPEMAEMQAKLGKLEAMLQAAKIDESVANVENKRADTLAKLRTAYSAQQPQVHEDKITGNLTQLPEAPEPDMGRAFQDLSQLPFAYPKPTPGALDQMAAFAGPPQPAQDFGPGAPDDNAEPLDGGPLNGNAMLPPPQGALSPQGEMMPQ